MTRETKQCQSCRQQFAIEPEDFDFYTKIEVPPPTWCPDCRQQRRYAWRNERVLYRRNCDLCGKSTVTIYSPSKTFKVYCPPCWWGDGWDPFSFGRDFDFSRPFFPQFEELRREIPRLALLTKNSVNSEYVNHGTNNKNCYLSFAIIDSENILYSTNVFGGRDCLDCYWAEDKTERLYECMNIYTSYRCQNSILLNSCTDCFYSYDLRGCSNCFLSWNLRNKQYHILNQPYSKEAYMKKMEEYRLGSYVSRQKLHDQFLEMMEKQALHRFAVQEQSVGVSGNFIFESKNTRNAFDVFQMEDSNYVTVTLKGKGVMDTYHAGYACELIYDSQAIIRGYNTLFSHLSYDNASIAYCDTCHNSQNLFGCVSVKKGTYCILNKRYSPEEYAVLREKIISHMKETGEFGGFFPVELSPFGYNETQGQVYMPLTKEEVLKKGWRWEEQVPGTFGRETIKEIPDDIKEVGADITSQVLACSLCSKNYNIVQPELDFYQQENIPIPRQCPDCRYSKRISMRLPRKLWLGKCRCAGKNSENQSYQNTVTHFHGESSCPNEFQTPYAPDRPEVVYCEQCYNAEIV